MRQFDPHHLAAMRELQVRQQRLGFQRHGMGDNARALSQEQPHGLEQRGIQAAAKENRIRRFQTGERRGRVSGDDRNFVRQAKGSGVGADIGGAVLARLNRDRLADNAIARTGRLVIWPSLAKSSSARPDTRGNPVAPAASSATATGLAAESVGK